MDFFSFFLLLCVRDPRDGRVCCAAWAHGVRIGGVVGSRTGNGELSLTLQESSVGVDELVRLDITNRDTGHVGGICRESESSGVEGAGDVEVARSLSPNEDIERDFRALLASVAGARALGSMFRRSRDIERKSCR